ncbi:MAG: DUF5134 domain-containing protein [Actinomycetota bacterium]|uniref:DUF5134 domain-containing protein n=1 Tax=Mycobacterium lentiflavum TaxID=141349 RepID=A0ABY3UQT8_MYCLN|nr:DUF5134 domain-containing protein [Mycobacterium lentiflavum]MEE3062901.1 DUF5134 domain-containing protein [Actinomycetota bacterium]ULP40815.1 DUF5134 domain-containing protein [Mycobacterium lentiflavum]
MIQDIFLRWIATVLFVLSAVVCVHAIATGRRSWTQVAGVALQLIMSIAMLVMVWPWGATLPTAGPLVFFLLAGFWFLAVGFSDADHRVINGYHALKMFAMSWMYAVMNGGWLAGQAGTAQGAHHMTSPHTNMPDMDMPGMDMSGMDMSSPSNGYPGWIEAVNWFWTIVFAIATVWWLYRSRGPHKHELPKHELSQPRNDILDAFRQAMMAVGMAITYGTML